MASISLNSELPEEFLSDILITAFDGHYGSAWAWFEPVGDGWLGTKSPSDPNATTTEIWMDVKCRLQEDYFYGDPIFDTRDGFVIDHDSVAQGLSRIINDDYLGLEREARLAEKTSILKAFGSATEKGELHGRPYKWIRGAEGEPRLIVETGETARGHRAHITRCVMNAINGVDEGIDIDAGDADVIIQAAAFGKVPFS